MDEQCNLHCPKVTLHNRIYWNVSFFNTLRPRQNGHHFADDIFKCSFLDENISIPIRISLFVPKCLINNNPALVQIMAWRRPGDNPSSEPMMVSLPTHICVTRPKISIVSRVSIIKYHGKMQISNGCWIMV